MPIAPAHAPPPARAPLAPGLVLGLVLGLAVACGASEGPAAAPPPSPVAVDPPSASGSSEPGADSAPPADAGRPSDAAPDARPKGCGAFLAARDAFACAKDGMSRGKCPDGVTLTEETCARGCLRALAKDAGADAGKDAVCMGTTTPWSCTGTFSTERALNGDYYLTAFGCWVDTAGGKHGDTGDNCVPSCLADLKRLGLCAGADTGRACEERLSWFVADAGRFGCGARVRVQNPANGKSVVAVAIDSGPACSIERTAQKAVLDASGRVNRELFGVDHGVVDRALVHVVEVDSTTPLGL